MLNLCFAFLVQALVGGVRPLRGRADMFVQVKLIHMVLFVVV